MFLASKKDLKMFNYKSCNCLYCAKLKMGKHQTGCRHIAASAFRLRRR